MTTLADITIADAPTRPWNAEGVVLLPQLFGDGILDAYEAEWRVWNEGRPATGWPEACPYMKADCLRVICCDRRLATELECIVGEAAGLHLNLTPWLSTQRDWHQDCYLNPVGVGDNYAAVWIALEDIHPDSGPFQYVPGSHYWPRVTHEAMGKHFDTTDPRWPWQTEQMLTGLFQERIACSESSIVTHLPKRGDVLVWHPRLVHRGSKPNVPGMSRKAIIAHYSALSVRPDFPPAVRQPNGGWYFPIVEG